MVDHKKLSGVLGSQVVGDVKVQHGNMAPAVDINTFRKDAEESRLVDAILNITNSDTGTLEALWKRIHNELRNREEALKRTAAQALLGKACKLRQDYGSRQAWVYSKVIRIDDHGILQVLQFSEVDDIRLTLECRLVSYAKDLGEVIEPDEWNSQYSAFMNRLQLAGFPIEGARAT